MRRSRLFYFSQVDAVACEALALLLQFPSDAVPGVFPFYDQSTLQDEAAAQWDIIVEIIKIFVSRNGWVEAIAAVWNKIDNEKWQHVQTCVSSSAAFL